MKNSKFLMTMVIGAALAASARTETTDLLQSSNPIRFSSFWTGSTDAVTNRAEISNDTSNYKTLMIVGNKSAGLGRRVSIWDRLEVNGQLIIAGRNTNNLALSLTSWGSGWGSGMQFENTGGGGRKYGIYVDNSPDNLWHFVDETEHKNRMVVNRYGNVGIGVDSPGLVYKLSVNGTIRAKEVVVETARQGQLLNFNILLLSSKSNYVQLMLSCTVVCTTHAGCRYAVLMSV